MADSSSERRGDGVEAPPLGFHCAIRTPWKLAARSKPVKLGALVSYRTLAIVLAQKGKKKHGIELSDRPSHGCVTSVEDPLRAHA